MPRRSLALLAVLVLASGLAGCSRLLGNRYDNFTAYYNTYYNAREGFERSEERLLEQERPVDRARFLTLFFESDAQGNRSNEGFTNAVDKGADLLRDHPESKWVDDALLLIGKARFYQADWAGAEEKFREVLALGASRLNDEATFWLGRTLTAAERYDDAALTLREGLDREGLSERWASPMRLALAEVDVRRGDLDQAIGALQTGIEGVRDDELAARASFLLGQVYEALDQSAKASEAYGRVLRYRPRYELAYAAQLSQALALGLGGEPEAALASLDRMRRDDKNIQSLAEIEVTRARVLAAADRPGDARDLLRDLLYDPDPAFQVGSATGLVHYRLAEVYRDGLDDYINAAAHYDTAATALRQAPATNVAYTREAVTDAPARSETFGSYARVSASIAEMDSLLYLGSLSEDEFAAAVEQIQQDRQAAADEEARERSRRLAEEGFGGATAGGIRPGRDPGEEGAGDGASGAALGFLGFRNPVRVQEQLIGFQARWGDRPLMPNWRRSAAIGGGVEVGQEIAEGLEGVPGIQTPGFQNLDLVDVSVVPRDPLTQQAMRLDRAAARYELGNVLFLSLGEPARAVPWYRRVIDEDGASPLVQRAYFALAEAQRTLGNEAEANDLYREVLDRFPGDRLNDQARERLGLAPSVVVEADSLAEAEAAYTLAYTTWKAGDHKVALDQMLSIGEQYPTTPVAARARLAAGELYTEWAAGDSTTLLATVPQFEDPPERPSPSTAILTPDSTASLALPDSGGVGIPGTAQVPSDSTLAMPDAGAAATSGEMLDPWLVALYASIEEDYPGTPYAERARATRTALSDLYAWETQVARADSLAADSANAEGPGIIPGPTEGPGTERLLGNGSIRVGGVSWAVYVGQRRPKAVEILLALDELGYQTALLVNRTDQGMRFNVLVGQFVDEEEALAARASLPRVRSAESEPTIVSVEVEPRWLQSPQTVRRIEGQ